MKIGSSKLSTSNLTQSIGSIPMPNIKQSNQQDLIKLALKRTGDINNISYHTVIENIESESIDGNDKNSNFNLKNVEEYPNYNKYLQRLISKPRNVYFGKEKFTDVTKCKYLKKALNGIGLYYKLIDTQRNKFIDKNNCHYSFMQPRSMEELKKKRYCYRRIANEHSGFYTRMPDFVNTKLAAFDANRQVFKITSNSYTNYEQNIHDYYEYCRKENIFTAQATVDDISNDLTGISSIPRIVSYNASGVVISGRKFISIFAPIADEILVYNFAPLTDDQIDNSIAFVIEVHNPNLHIICSTKNYREFDQNEYPLSSKLDEIEATLVFDDVFIPWNRIFIFKNIQLSNTFYEKTKANLHSGHQTVIRFFSLLELLYGIGDECKKLYNFNSIENFNSLMGEMTYLMELLRGLLYLSETKSTTDHNGFFHPNESYIQMCRFYIKENYQKILDIINDIQNIFSVYQSVNDSYEINLNKDFIISEDIKKILKNLVWDLSGSELSKKHVMIEKFANTPFKEEDLFQKLYKSSNKELSKFALTRTVSDLIKTYSGLFILKDDKMLLTKKKDEEKWSIPLQEIKNYENPEDIAAMIISKIIDNNGLEKELQFVDCFFGPSNDLQFPLSAMIYKATFDSNIQIRNIVIDVDFKFVDLILNDDYTIITNNIIKSISL